MDARNTVIIRVDNGAASVVHVPQGVVVEIRDYDIDDYTGIDAEMLPRDETGEPYRVQVHENEEDDDADIPS